MKTLLEHLYELKIASLGDDPGVSYAKRIVTIELLALELGWKHLMSTEDLNLHIHREELC